MRKLMTIWIACGLFACAAMGTDHKEKTVTITGTTNLATAVTQTIDTARGQIVQLHVILGTATNVDVDVFVDPQETLEDNFTLYSVDDVVADDVLFPVFDRNSSSGAALTSDPPGTYVCMGDPIKCVASDFAVTNGTVLIRLVYKRN